MAASLNYCCLGGPIDQYAPIDDNPANDEFVGQLRAHGLAYDIGIGGEKYSYAVDNALRKYDQAAYLAPEGRVRTY